MGTHSLRIELKNMSASAASAASTASVSDSGAAAVSDAIGFKMSNIRAAVSALESAIDALCNRGSNSYENIDADNKSVWNTSKAHEALLEDVANAALKALTFGHENYFRHFQHLFDRLVDEVQFRGASLIIQHLVIIAVSLRAEPDHESNFALFNIFSDQLRITLAMFKKTDWATPYEKSQGKKVKIGQTGGQIYDRAGFKTLTMIHLGICESIGGLDAVGALQPAFELLATDAGFDWGRKYTAKPKQQKEHLPKPPRSTYAEGLPTDQFPEKKMSTTAPPPSSWADTSVGYPPLMAAGGYAMVPQQMLMQPQQQVAVVAQAKVQEKGTLDALGVILQHTRERGISDEAIMRALLALQPDQA